MSAVFMLAVAICIVCSLYLYDHYEKGHPDTEDQKHISRQIGYIIKVFILSMILFYCSGALFQTNDGASTYLLALLVSHFIVKEYESLK